MIEAFCRNFRLYNRNENRKIAYVTSKCRIKTMFKTKYPTMTIYLNTKKFNMYTHTRSSARYVLIKTSRTHDSFVHFIIYFHIYIYMYNSYYYILI